MQPLSYAVAFLAVAFMQNKVPFNVTPASRENVTLNFSRRALYPQNLQLHRLINGRSTRNRAQCEPGVGWSCPVMCGSSLNRSGPIREAIHELHGENSQAKNRNQKTDDPAYPG